MAAFSQAGFEYFLGNDCETSKPKRQAPLLIQNAGRQNKRPMLSAQIELESGRCRGTSLEEISGHALKIKWMSEALIALKALDAVKTEVEIEKEGARNKTKRGYIDKSGKFVCQPAN